MAIDIPVRQPRNIFETSTSNEKILNELAKQRLENQYYGPNIESEMANRNALTQGYNINNQYAPERLRLANEKSKLENQYYEPNIMSEIGLRGAQANNFRSEANKTNSLLPYEIEEKKLKNKYYPEYTQSQITLNNQGGRGGMGVGQKEIIGLQRQLMQDHPEWDSNTANQAASSYLSGGNSLPDGTKLPELSGIGRTYVAQIQKRNSTAAVQNQAANMSVLSDDINNIDITPLKKFVGLKGRLDYAKYATQMSMGQPVPQEFRDYETFKNITSNFAMDSLRKGFGTSVVPSYVYATLGKASNPASTWWHDPKQVENDWSATKKWINDNSKKYKTLSTQGISGLNNNNSSNENNLSNKKATLRYNKQTGNFEEIL